MQDSEPVIKRWSDLRGLAVVTINSGKKVGTLEDFSFESHTNNIRALQVKTGLLSRRVLLVTAISAIGQDAVTFPDEDQLVKEKDEAQLKTLVSGSSLLGYRVLSEGGNLVGTTGDVLLNITVPSSLRIAGFELAGGLRERISGRYSSFTTEDIIRYGDDVLVISDIVAKALQ